MQSIGVNELLAQLATDQFLKLESDVRGSTIQLGNYFPPQKLHL